MSTIRRRTLPADHFTIIANGWLRDAALSWGARGLLAWLASHAVDYEVTEAAIIESGPMGRDGVRTLIYELEQAGYLRRDRTYLPGGGSAVSYVLAEPGDGYSDSRDDGNPDPRPDQGEQGVSAGRTDDGDSDPRTSYRENQKKNKTPSVSPRASRSERATRLPEDFQPDDQMRAWYVKEELGGVIDGRIEHQKFVNYWCSKAGRDARKIDWRRTWMNWMLSAAQRAERRPGTAVAPYAAPAYRPSTTDQRVAQGLALAEKFRKLDEQEGKL